MQGTRARTRLNFRCSLRLRQKLAEAAKRSHVTLSEQARISLEKLYEVRDEETVWLPPLLREESRKAS